jgi:hypothetical protein
MCGIAGILEPDRAGDAAWLAAAAATMADSLAHRGPDHGATWVDGPAGLGLGHRRLAIVDLSPAGDQPMVSACGRFVIAYNGEVFNAAELRAEIEATRGPHHWRGHSDTEPPRVCRRLFGLSHAANAGCSSAAWYWASASPGRMAPIWRRCCCPRAIACTA